MEPALDLLLQGMQLKKLLEQELSIFHKKYNLKKIDVQILLYLYYAEDKNTFSALVELGAFTKGHISQSIHHLQTLQLIETTPDSTDKRRIHIFLNEKSLQILREIREVYEKINKIIYAEISEEEQKQFHQTTKQIIQNIISATI